MEEIERETLLEFIRESHERLKEIFTYIEGDNYVAAAYATGQLECLHGTLLGALEPEVDEDQDDECPNEEIRDFLRGFYAKCRK
jgi:hypothetical protein